MKTNRISTGIILSILLVIYSQYSTFLFTGEGSVRLLSINDDEFILTGNILTLNNEQESVDAIYIKGGKIHDIGTKKQIFEQYCGNVPILVRNFDQYTILPGFIDGHTHLFGGAYEEDGFNISKAQTLALSYGFTTVLEKFAHQDLIDALQEAELTNELKMRVNIFPSYNDAILDDERKMILLETWFPQNPPILDENKFVRIPGIKIFVDGAFVPGRGLWAVSIPYTEEQKAYIREWLPDEVLNDYGDLYWEQGVLNQVVKQAQNSGYRVAFHAMGDRAIETTLNAIEYALDGKSNSEIRHQIEHNSYVRPDLVPRYQELDVFTSVRGYYPTCDQDEFLEFFNETVDWNVKRYELPGVVTHSYLETDFGWTHESNDNSSSRNINPFLHLYGLVTRKHVAPNQMVCDPDPWVKKYEITVSKALEIMTIGGAYAASQENVIGSIEEGKYADLIVISDSPTEIAVEKLKDITVLLTMIGGDICYQQEDFYWEETLLTKQKTTLSSITTLSSDILSTTVKSTAQNATTSEKTSIDVFHLFLALALLIGMARKKRSSHRKGFKNNNSQMYHW